MTLANAEYVETMPHTELLIETAFEQAAVAAVKSAQKRIWVMAYRWRWYKDFPEKPIQRLNVAIMKAKQHGIQVRALLQDKDFMAHLKSLGFDARVMTDNRTLHVKAIMVDDTHLLIGSHNMTDRAFRHNRELSIVVHDLEPILQFETYFNGLWIGAGI